MEGLAEAMHKALQQRREAQLYRQRRVVDGPQGPEICIDGRTLLNFCSNDYLGLANHPKVIEAMQRGTAEYGVGSGAAHLVTGHNRAHHTLEEELADFTGRPRALLFSTGYMANLGAVTSLLGSGDAIFEDRLNHASLLDAGLMSRARLNRYAHGDSEVLANKLEVSQGKRKLVVTDGVFSMDGDIAPLPQLAKVAKSHGAWLMVDDAHGLGVLGEQGGGCLEYHQLGLEDVPVLMGTLGKGFGSFGAFVAGSEELIETLIQQARSYIYTTALPPAVAEASRTSLALIREEAWRREHLHSLILQFREGAAGLGMKLMPSPTPIQPLSVGEAATAMAMSEALYAKGLMISAIRPPTVAEGTSRLRITLSAAHSKAQVDRLLTALAEVLADFPQYKEADVQGQAG